ncbi:glycosyltransferase family 2 protein [Microvirga arsenatis]|nr:glycosyltransferase family 2 protein [Microvirga arsenatis]
MTRKPQLTEVRKNISISVIIPAFNGASGLLRSIASLREQTLAPLEIIVVNDGSTDGTRAIAEQARAAGLIDLVIHHGSRCGRSPAVNAGARFARGDLLLAMDPDTVFAPTALMRLAAAFNDPRVAAACCNIGVRNAGATLWAALQSLEYLMSISAGKSFLNMIGAISCCSGACSMYRRDVFVDQGGPDVGPGEDLEFTLRLRRLGYQVRFVSEAWAETSVPESAINLVRQRLRWDRDAFRIRLIQYGELKLFRAEMLSDTLQRLDFVVFDLVPTLSLPFYIAYCVILFGPETPLFLGGGYILSLGISLFNIALSSLMVSQSHTFFSLTIALIFPLYQGIAMKLVRGMAFTFELLFSASRHDDYVPPRVRRALTAHRT